jgi:hypothetical protein
VPDADLSGSKAHEWITVTGDCEAVDKDILACLEKVGGLKGKADDETKKLGDLKAKHFKKEVLHKDCGVEKG